MDVSIKYFSNNDVVELSCTFLLFLVLGVLMLITSFLVGLFPRSLLDNQGGMAANNIYYTKSKGTLLTYLFLFDHLALVSVRQISEQG